MHQSPASRRSQRGVTLIIAMLMLVVIGIMSVAIMRNATSSDQVTNNNRLQAQASQAAQMALRFCEDQLLLGSSGKVQAIPFNTSYNWPDKKNWTTGGAHMAYTLTPADVTGGTANFPAVAPQCISETMKNQGGVVYIVTARGFSNDFRADSSYATRSGAVVWLQSTVYMP